MQVERTQSVSGAHNLSHQNWVEAGRVRTSFSIIHDGSGIILQYFVEEPSVRAVNTGFNSPVWEDSCVEFFFAPEGEEGYYNFEMNAIGTLLGAYGKGRHEREWLPVWALEKVEILPSLGREPFDEIHRLTQWNLQVRIPVESLLFSNIEDLTGIRGTANFYKCGDKLKRPHFLSWEPVPLPEPDFHQPRFFGRLIFR